MLQPLTPPSQELVVLRGPVVGVREGRETRNIQFKVILNEFYVQFPQIGEEVAKFLEIIKIMKFED